MKYPESKHTAAVKLFGFVSYGTFCSFAAVYCAEP